MTYINWVVIYESESVRRTDVDMENPLKNSSNKIFYNARYVGWYWILAQKTYYYSLKNNI